MKKQIIIITSFLFLFAKPAVSHRGGNGGSDIELLLKTRMLQIGVFMNSTVGKEAFKIINSETITSSINQIDIDLETDPVLDRFGKERTCVNDPAKFIVTCNAQKIIALLDNKQFDILIGILFHEILGINQVELGHQDQVSSYPISSKIIPYAQLILDTPIQEKSIRPEFYGIDNRSYGVTFVNEETQETVRMICLNDNVEINRCKNFNVVRRFENMQSPILSEVVSINRDDIKKINDIKSPQSDEVRKLIKELEELNSKGYNYLTFSFNSYGRYSKSSYGFGAGLDQSLRDDGFNITPNGSDLAFYYILANLTVVPLLTKAIDVPVEVVKQAGNVVVYPFKAIMTSIKATSTEYKIKQLDRFIKKVKLLFNSEDNLSIVNKAVVLSEEEFLSVIDFSKRMILATKEMQVKTQCK